MMAMYKLYVIIHKRTDFKNIGQKIYETLYPEYYAKKRADARNALAQLCIVDTIVNSLNS